MQCALNIKYRNSVHLKFQVLSSSKDFTREVGNIFNIYVTNLSLFGKEDFSFPSEAETGSLQDFTIVDLTCRTYTQYYLDGCHCYLLLPSPTSEAAP